MKKECKGKKSEDSDVLNGNNGLNCVDLVNDGTFDDKTGETEKKLSTGSNLSSNSIGSFDLLEAGAAPSPTTEDHPESETKDQNVNYEGDVASVPEFNEGLEIPKKTQADVPENDEQSKTSADVGELPSKSDAEKTETTLATSENNEGAPEAFSSYVLPKEKEAPKTGSPKSPRIIVCHPDDSGQNKRKSSEIDENAAKIPHVPHVLEKDQKEKSAVESDEIVMLQRNSYFDHRLSAQINILMDEKIKKAQRSTFRRRAISETRSEDFLQDLTDSEAAILRFLAENNRNVERQLEFKNVFRTLKFGDLFEKVTAADDRGVLNIYEISIIFMLSLAILVFFIRMMISNFKNGILISVVSFFSGYYYGDYKKSHDHQFGLQDEPLPVPTPPTLPPVVVSEPIVPDFNSSYFGSCAVQFSFESFANRTCLAQTAELPIDVIFLTVSRYWNYFGWIVLFYGILTFGYRIVKWLKGTRTRRTISETAEPISPKPLILEPSPHPSPMLAFRRKSLQHEPGLSPIRESATETPQPKNDAFDFMSNTATAAVTSPNKKTSDPFADVRLLLEKPMNGTTNKETIGKAGSLNLESVSSTASDFSSSTVSSFQDESTTLNVSINTFDPLTLSENPEVIQIVPEPPGNPHTFTIVVLGDSGVGKSTLICSLANYAKWPKFEQICKKVDKLEVCIPVRFDINYRDGSPSKTVSVGDDESNLNENFNAAGQSVTQMPKVHECTFGVHRLRIIDTPGLNDTRGLEQDQRHLEQIKKIIQNQPEIHAIIFVLKSNQSKLTPEFELAMRSLLSIFPKSAVQNIFFFYTFSVGTFFAIGDVMGPLVEFSKKFKATQSLAIPVGADRGFCIDSESFRYLLAKNQKIQYSTRKEKDFAYSWDKSAESIAEFTNALKDLPPIKGKDIVFAENLVKTALNFCDWHEANGSNVPAEDKAEFDANLADLLKSVLNKTMPLEMPRIKRVLAVLNCGSVLTDNSAVLERIKTLLKIQKKLEN